MTRAGKVLLGLIGAGIGKSLSPAMHEEEARCQGVHLLYQLIDLDEQGRSASQLPQLLDAAQAMGFAGLNVTYPCKQAVMPFLDVLSPEAHAMQAVNTVVFRGGQRMGHNTDGPGWRWGFDRALPGAGLETVVLLGAGGAGSAIAHALMSLPLRELRIVDTDSARASALAASVCAAHGLRAVCMPEARTALAGDVSGIIHATPTGMDKMPGMPLPAHLLRPAMWVSEAVYFPLETPLVRAARALGCRVMDGGNMAVGQAVGAFELFTGMKADAARMDRHFRRLAEAR